MWWCRPRPTRFEVEVLERLNLLIRRSGVELMSLQALDAAIAGSEAAANTLAEAVAANTEVLLQLRDQASPDLQAEIDRIVSQNQKITTLADQIKADDAPPTAVNPTGDPLAGGGLGNAAGSTGGGVGGIPPTVTTQPLTATTPQPDTTGTTTAPPENDTGLGGAPGSGASLVP